MDNLETDSTNNNPVIKPEKEKKKKKSSNPNNGVASGSSSSQAQANAPPPQTAREMVAEMEEEEKREIEEKKKQRREPPIVFKDVCNTPEELLDNLEQSLGSIELNEEEMRCLKELREYCLGDEGSWVLSDDFLGFIGRILLTDSSIHDDSKVYCLKLLAWIAVTKDDVILVLHQDRRDHIIMRYANNIDQLSVGCQEGVALLLCNLFENLSTSEWLLYISEWETVGFGANSGVSVTSNIRVTTKVAVHALLCKELRDVGSALVYNMVAKEVKTAVSVRRRGGGGVDGHPPSFCEKQPPVPEPLCWRGLKALLRCCQLARGEVPNLIKMVGPSPGELRGNVSPRCDEIIDSIITLMK
ncbi:hypothetical protein Ocin01_01900 [Orchesella cincta]|uniref:Uncharacterized protein n=1 Tax=Orchesella cincta TaxID=48709 RepID=A0A1D2NHR4_ORCCI|nr:hypothetical protein Ocin01_01900 [Orchesella cincta]